MEGRTLAYTTRKLQLNATSASREPKRNRRYNGKAAPSGATATSVRTARYAKRRCVTYAPQCRESKCLGRWTRSAKADSRFVESREGLDMTGREIAFLTADVKAVPGKGQSAHYVFASRDDLPCSERSFYLHVENKGIDVRKMDPVQEGETQEARQEEVRPP